MLILTPLDLMGGDFPKEVIKMVKCDMCGMEIPKGKEVRKRDKTLCPMCAKKM